MEIITTFIQNFLHHFSQIGLTEIGILLSIIVLDGALSADNSLAINALVRNLPDGIQQKAVYLGMAFAAFLRIIALCFAAFIMANPWVQILGGLYLIKLCINHFRKSDEDEGQIKIKKSLIKVLIAIGFLDLSLSTDNIIAVVSLSSNLAIVIIGVLLSIVMLAVATQITRIFMNRYPSLEGAAYMILGFLGISMLISHGSEFILWSKDFILTHESLIHQMKFEVTELMTIAGVLCIVAGAIIKDEISKRKNKNVAIIGETI